MGSFRIISYNYMRISNSLKKFNLRRISMVIYWKAPHILNPWIRNIAKRKSYWLFLEDAKKIIIVKTGKIRHINIHLHFLFILYLKQVKHVIRNIFSLKIYKEKEQKKEYNCIITSLKHWMKLWINARLLMSTQSIKCTATEKSVMGQGDDVCICCSVLT